MHKGVISRLFFVVLVPYSGYHHFPGAHSLLIVLGRWVGVEVIHTPTGVGVDRY